MAYWFTFISFIFTAIEVSGFAFPRSEAELVWCEANALSSVWT